jgi:hypothetical protein
MTLTLKQEITLDIDVEYEAFDGSVEVTGVYIAGGSRRVDVWEALCLDDQKALEEACWEDVVEREAAAEEAALEARRDEEFK